MKWVWRTLGALVALLLLAVLVLWLAGFRSSAGYGVATVEINRPASHVWRYLTDDTLVTKWVGGLTEIHPQAGTPAGVGWRARMVVVMDGERFELDWETTAFEEPRHIGFVARSPAAAGIGFVEKGEYRLEEAGGRTRLSLAARTEYTGWFARFDGADYHPGRPEKSDRGSTAFEKPGGS